MSSSGVFLITTDGIEIIKEEELKDDDYYSWVGSYVDLIANTAAKAKIQPKIQLVATKAEPDTTEQIRRVGAKILEMTKKHLEAVDGDICFFLVDEMMVIRWTQESMEHFSMTLSTLSTNEQLNEKQEGGTPMEWFDITKEMKSIPKLLLSVSEVSEIQQKMREETGVSGNLKQKDVEMLKKLKSVAEQLKGEERAAVKERAQEELEPNVISTTTPEKDTWEGPAESEGENQEDEMGPKEDMTKRDAELSDM